MEGWGVTHRELMNDVLEYIHAHFSEEITLNILADQFFYSPDYLCKVFKREVGCGFSSYLRSVRMEYAISLLKTGAYPVTEIATKSGYSIHAFYQVFKAYAGTTPGGYMRGYSHQNGLL